MQIILCPRRGTFAIRQLKRYQVALTKTGKIQFYKVTPFTDLEALRERKEKYWERVSVIYAYCREEARIKAKEEFKIK